METEKNQMILQLNMIFLESSRTSQSPSISEGSPLSGTAPNTPPDYNTNDVTLNTAPFTNMLHTPGTNHSPEQEDFS